MATLCATLAFNSNQALFEPYLTQWRLVTDGEPFRTHTSHLWPVRYRGRAAMLKVATAPEEKWGGGLMVWWDGDGAARVLEHEGDALLLERLEGDSLVALARSGPPGDDEASRILCQVAARLHAPRNRSWPELIPLRQWFKELEPAAARFGGILREAAQVAHGLLESPQGVTVLHGDLHHGNVLDGGERGWLAIDPKRLVGERGFDFANLFCNPDEETALAPGRLVRQSFVVAEAANLERERLLQWVLAYAGLSAAWSLGDGDDPNLALAVAHLTTAQIVASQLEKT